MGTHSNDKGQRQTSDTDIQSNSGDVIDVPPKLMGRDDKNTIGLDTHLGQKQLPNEIISLIIHHLPEPHQGTLCQCALVTKQFYAIVSPLIWKKIGFWDNMCTQRLLTSLSTISQQRLATIGQHILELRLQGPHWMDDQLTRLIPHIPDLKYLSMKQSSHITFTSFQQLPYHFQHLTSVQLISNQLTDVLFSSLGQYCRQLKDLEWVISRNQSPEWLAMLLPCPLERLRLFSFHTTSNYEWTTIIQKFDHLVWLHLTGSKRCISVFLQLATDDNYIVDGINNADGNNTISTTTTTAVASSRHSQLTTLSLNSCDDIDDMTFIRFIKTQPRLEALDLSAPEQLTDDSLDAMTIWLPQLESLVLTLNDNISPNGIRQLIRGCTHLQYVKLYRCKHVSSTDFPELVFSDPRNWGNVALDEWAIDKIRLGNTKNE